MSETPRSIHISLNTGTVIKILVMIVLLLVLYYLSDVVLVFIAAVVIASAIEPAISRLQKFRFPRVLAVVTVYIIMAALLTGVFLFFLPIVANETVSFIQNIPRTISLDDLWSPIRSIGFNFGALSS